jgi:hypothetical protein
MQENVVFIEFHYIDCRNKRAKINAILMRDLRINTAML